MNEIGVTICCITYNHENFIRDAIDSFLMQKTNFMIEIIIHDDCSTDNTIAIVREYEKKYPNIIRGVYENENQWSKGNSALLQLIASHAHGKYIAICEGDDYWTDDYKLQRQYDILETHKEISCSFHDASIVSVDKTIINKSMLREKKAYKGKSCGYNCEEVLALDFYPTASIFYRCDLLQYATLPDYFWNGYCGDLPTRIKLASLGQSYCFDEQMSAYRVGNPNSASGQIVRQKSRICDTMDAHIKILKSFDEDTQRVYHEAVESVILDKEILKFRQFGDIKKLESQKYRKRFHDLPLKTRVKCYLLHYFPSFEDLVNRIIKKKK